MRKLVVLWLLSLSLGSAQAMGLGAPEFESSARTEWERFLSVNLDYDACPQPCAVYDASLEAATGGDWSNLVAKARATYAYDAAWVASFQKCESFCASLTGETGFLAARTVGRQTTTVLSDVTVISKGKVVGRGNVYIGDTLRGIESGSIKPRDIFQNRPVPGRTTPELPVKPPGYYQEFVHPTPGVSRAGSQRIVRGAGGELYYTPDHYDSFVPLN